MVVVGVEKSGWTRKLLLTKTTAQVEAAGSNGHLLRRGKNGIEEVKGECFKDDSKGPE